MGQIETIGAGALGLTAALWGIVGVSALISWALIRLTPLGVAALGMPLGLWHWLVLLPWLGFMLYGEGYKGFQKGFAPRVAARARYLLHHATPVRALLAPLFLMGFFHATRRRQIVSIVVTAGIFALVLIVSQLPQPWRGIIDLGVVAGLGWGLVAIWLFAWQALTAATFAYSPETPDAPAGAGDRHE